MFVSVPAGSVGVKTRFGAVVGVMQPGMNIKLPSLFENVTIMNSRVLKTEVKAEAGSSDLQTVSTDIVVNYHIDAKKAQDIFQKIGDNQIVEDTILRPAVSEVVKAAVAKKTAENILKERPKLKQDIDKELASRMKRYDVFIDDVSIVNVDSVLLSFIFYFTPFLLSLVLISMILHISEIRDTILSPTLSANS